MTSSTVLTLITVGALSLVPLLFLATTSFVKISIVFSLLRNALGTAQVPSGSVVAALAAILTLYVMAPVGVEMSAAAGPALGEVNLADPLAEPEPLGRAVQLGAEPLRAFLARNAGAREKTLFADLARDAWPPDQAASVEGDGILVVLPAFLITELAEAFILGFLVLLPFLVVDLVVTNVLMSMGVASLSPAQVSLPFKLLLFVLADGFFLLSRALVLGYA